MEKEIAGSACQTLATGPGRFFAGEEKRPGTICSRIRKEHCKITVKSLLYVEIKYTAEVYSVQDYYYHICLNLGISDQKSGQIHVRMLNILSVCVRSSPFIARRRIMHFRAGVAI